ncbi:hypothetical protein PFICI_09525 [Pestalotiopsis fici W106-1]|uniref:Uncharacterized protein n=1 Tax=Pestalotiopsis fici (strain W106-1 / CGMCC3.15140) TaxID=1229662 RepID=W3X2Q2_PESFW|nr:uncharacterized protein PFICI_09525 [Pestalotiopsis fici W106-1]ETS79672.1 hypothetical protein PFICI_09525 [Pestalotiopsis fici W106-1]
MMFTHVEDDDSNDSNDSDDSDDSDAGNTQDELLKEWNDLMSPVLNNDTNRNASKTPIILPIANELLVEFDVVKWRQRLDDIRRTRYNQSMRWTKGEFSPRPRAENLLWLQVYLLDCEIRQLIKSLRSIVRIEGEILLEPPRELEITSERIAQAVRRAWADMDEDSIQDPLVALDRKIAGELGVSLSEDDTSSYIRQLADLLKLRCVFFAAYLMAIPDSSEFLRYHQSGADIRLPMI